MNNYAQNLARSLLGALMLALVAVAPCQYGLQVVGANVTIADLLLLAAFATALFSGAISPKMPLCNIAFLFFSLVSCAFSDMRALSLREWAQFALYFAAGERTVAAALRVGGVKWLRNGLAVFLLSGFATVLLALVQYFSDLPETATFGMSGFSVRGAFLNRNVLGGYLALLLPFCASLLLQKELWLFCPSDSGQNGFVCFLVARIFLVLLLAVGLFVCLSGAALFTIMSVILLILLRRNKLLAFAASLVSLAVFMYIAPCTPRDNFATPVTSVALYDFDSGAPTRRYPEWQAALSMAFERPFVGMGTGTYQKRIGAYYDAVPRATGPTEPDIQNLYLVLASSAGIPAMLAFVAMLFCACSGKSQVASGAKWALLAFGIVAIWHPLLVRGLGLPLVFMMAVAGLSGRE